MHPLCISHYTDHTYVWYSQYTHCVPLPSPLLPLLGSPAFHISISTSPRGFVPVCSPLPRSMSASSSPRAGWVGWERGGILFSLFSSESRKRTFPFLVCYLHMPSARDYTRGILLLASLRAACDSPSPGGNIIPAFAPSVHGSELYSHPVARLYTRYTI